jgi:two-component system alkaline phosphatase synthesis response regulator PhoP
MPTILLVDDDEDLVQALSFSLTRNGYNVATAKNGAEAIAVACDLRPHVVLLDVMMPNLDGLTACRGIKTMEQTREIPVIMLTAKGDVETIKAAFKAGANDYVVKPFDMEKVLEKIREQLKRKPRVAAQEDNG